MVRARLLGRSLVVSFVVIGGSTAVFAYTNGRLPQSALSRIHHPSLALYLEHDAARAWNAMRANMLARGASDIYPGGGISAYRTYDQQVYAKKVYGSNAATPGTSNHGLGLAVDLATQTMRANLDRYGAPFGWAKKWSDASWEWWHIKYRAGVWNGGGGGGGGGGGSAGTVLRRGSQGPKVATLQRALNSHLGGGSAPTLKRGSTGGAVVNLQRALNARGGYGLATDGDFGPRTEAAVRNYQSRHGLAADGIVGPKTNASLGLGGGGGPQIAVDGAFGPATEAAVKAFQRSRGLTVDGIAGPQTLRALNLSSL